MEERIKMNTASLQKYFKSDYENFFAKHDLVLSGCFKISRSPVGIGNHNAIFSIKQKIPTKCYIGFSKNTIKKVDIVGFSSFDIVHQKFQNENFENTHKENKKMIQHINKFLKDNDIECGYNINILTENERGHGIGLSGTMSALIAVGLFVLSGKITIKDIENYDSFLESEVYKKIYIFARELDFIARYGNSLGLNGLSTFLPNNNPIAFFVEYIDKNADVGQINTKKFFYKDLSQIAQNTMSIEGELPMDYAMIFSGQISHTDTVEYYRDKDLGTIENIIHTWKDVCYKKMLDIPSNRVFGKGFVVDTFDNNLMVINFRLLDSFKNIIHDSYDIKNIQTFIEVINDYRRYSTLIEKQSDFAEDFIEIYKIQSKIHAPIMGIMPVYSGKFGGGYLVATPKGMYRETIDKTLSNMQSKYPDCVVEYASWVDGTSKDGVKIEQYISNGLFSSYIQKDKVYVKSTVGENYMADYNDIMNSVKEGLMLNTVNNKIYMDGKKLTSEDIKSQTTTINILGILLNNLGKEISNKELEISSYSKNKNEMIGKIVIPLIEFLEKKTGKKLPLICKGSIYDFYIKLNFTDIPIYTISKI